MKLREARRVGPYGTSHPTHTPCVCRGLVFVTHEGVVHIKVWYAIYVEMRNITLSLPVELLRRAKVYAAEHETTINTLVRDLLLTALTGQSRSRVAAERFLKIAEVGPNSLIDPRVIKRDELHER